jgi:outer membrane protein assembly factor BamE (lipoprotein component of BamABCDE complex)
MKTLLLFSLPLFALLASCSSTPQSRIQKNPQLFQNLTPKQQSQVSQGQIDQGMSQSAVYLAMGNPDGKIRGNRDGRSFERWDYTMLIPVYTSGFGGYYGGGYHGRCGFYGGYYPTVTYIPTRGSSIYFNKGTVAGWERAAR